MFKIEYNWNCFKITAGNISAILHILLKNNSALWFMNTKIFTIVFCGLEFTLSGILCYNIFVHLLKLF